MGTHVCGGQKDDFSLNYALHVTVRDLEACFPSLALLTEQVGQTYVLLDRSPTELAQILLIKLQVSGLVRPKPLEDL